MTTNKTRDLVSKARSRLKERKIHNTEISEPAREDRFPAADIHTSNGAGREIFKRIPAKEVDPKRCKPWNFHNRDLSWLNNQRCADLIESISKNGQLEPGLVRTIDDPDYDYEIIYGVRRWYACSQIPGQKYLVKVTNADDKQCAILMHVENADSQDISESERAFSFRQQMQSGLFESQDELAKLMNVSKSHLSKLLRAAEVFDNKILKSVLINKIDVPIKYAYDVSLMLRNGKDQTVAMEVERILEEASNGKIFNNTEILKRIANAGKSQRINNYTKEVLFSSRGLDLVVLQRDASGALNLSISVGARGGDSKGVVLACTKAIEEYISK